MRRQLSFLMFFVAIATNGYCDGYAKQFPEVKGPLPEYQTIEKPIRIALVLGAGAARGMAHIGVLQELEDANIPIDLIVGCSAGSIVGSLYSHTPSAETVKKELVKLSFTDIIDYRIFFGQHGLCSGKSLQALLFKHLGSAHFEDLNIPVVVVATDLQNGETVKLNSGPVVPAVHASSAYPMLFDPVKIYGHTLLDGGVINPIPVNVAKEHDADIVIAVDVSAGLSDEMPGNPITVLMRCSDIQFRWLQKANIEAADIVIRPEIGHVGSFDDTCFEEVYQKAREACHAMIPKIRELMEEKGIQLEESE